MTQIFIIRQHPDKQTESHKTHYQAGPGIRNPNNFLGYRNKNRSIALTLTHYTIMYSTNNYSFPSFRGLELHAHQVTVKWD